MQFDELTAAAIKLKALEKQKAHLAAQLATKQRALDQANKLAEAKRKLTAMQEEVANLQKAYEETPGGSSQQQENHAKPTTFTMMSSPLNLRSISLSTPPHHSLPPYSKLHGR